MIERAEILHDQESLFPLLRMARSEVQRECCRSGPGAEGI
jgi:hypothetical protein